MNRTLTACIMFLLCLVFTVSCVSQSRAEEYFAMGKAYYDLGKLAEAEAWFTKSKFAEKTKMASLYNLGRIAFDQGRYTDAIDCFKVVLAKDPLNVIALKGIAYSYAKNGKTEQALANYKKAAELVPDSAEENYNYALLLAVVGRNTEAEEVLKKLSASTDENAKLLLARAQKAQKKPEAVDTYKNYLEKKDDPAIRFEYAEALEDQKLYAKALEEYSALNETASETSTPRKAAILFRIARVLLISDPTNAKSIPALEEALESGYNNVKEIDALLDKTAIPAAKKTELKKLVKK